MRSILLIAIGVFSSLTVSAQITTLRGLVTDPEGAVIPGAQVIVRSGNTVEFETRTDAEGVFLANVRGKQVTLEINATGFLKWERLKYQVPEAPVVDLGSIALSLLDPRDRIVDFAEPDSPPIETRESTISSELQNRPVAALASLRQSTSTFCTNVRDELGALIPNAKVKLVSARNSLAKRKYVLGTDADGNLRMDILNGIYKITFSQESYRSVTLRDVVWPPETRKCLQVTLKSSVPPHQIT